MYALKYVRLLFSLYIGCSLLVAADSAKLDAIHLPIYFEANSGQYPDEVKFLARGQRHTLFLTNDEAVLTAADNSVVRMKLVGSNPGSRLTGISATANRTNYLIGSDTSKWRTGVPTFAKVRQADVYTGIDLFYHESNQQIEYDFVVRPGANTDRIRLRYEGATKIEIDSHGDLLLTSAGGVLRHQKPIIYQGGGTGKKLIAGSFRKLSASEIGFVVGEYDHSSPLTIDPSLSYATFLGGNNDETLGGIATDGAGYLYVTGYTLSANFPSTSGAYRSTCGSAGICNGGTDAFITKITPDGTGLTYSTFLGGSGFDQAFRIRVDAAGNAYVYGSTASLDFPLTPGTLTDPMGSRTFPFLVKLNAAGSGLIYSTRLPGPIQNANIAGSTQGSLFAIDPSGAAYFANAAGPGFTTTAGAVQGAASGGNDVYALKISTDATSIQYATYLGGTGDESVNSIAVDSTGALYLAGTTASSDFPVTGGVIQSSRLSTDAHGFVAKLAPTGASLAFSTYLGGTGPDAANSIALDSANNILVSGVSSSGFPGPAPSLSIDSAHYLVRLAATGSTILNSAGINTGPIWLDQSNNIYTQSLGAVYKLDPGLTSVLLNIPICPYSSCTGYDRFVADSTGRMFGASRVVAAVLTTPNAFQASPAGGNDILLQRISPTGGNIQVFPPQITLTNPSSNGTVAVWSTGTPAALSTSYSATPGAPWLQIGGTNLIANPTSGTLSTFSTSINAGQAPTSSASTSLTVTAPGEDNSPVSIPVTYLHPTGPYLYSSCEPCLSVLTYVQGLNPNPLATNSFNLFSSDGSPFSVSSTATWMQASLSGPALLGNPGQGSNVVVSINGSVASTLAIGIYTGYVNVTGNLANSPVAIPVLLRVVAPTILPSLQSVSFVQQTGVAAVAAQTINFSANTLPANTFNDFVIPLTVSTSNPSWLSVSQTSLSTPGSISVSVNATGVSTGVYQASITVSGLNASINIPVTLTVTASSPIQSTPATVSLNPTTPSTQVSVASSSAISFSLGTSGGSWLTASSNSASVPATITIHAGTLPPGDYSGAVTLTPLTAGQNTLQIPVMYHVPPASQTLTFANPGTQSVGTTLLLSASATSGLSITFASTTPAVCTVFGSSLSSIGTGTCSVVATQAGNLSFANTSVTQSFTVSPGSQLITFNNPGTVALGTTPTLLATSTSGLSVTLASSTPGVCSVTGNSLHLASVGTCTITASQPGNGNYSAATSVTQSFSVSSAPLPLLSLTLSHVGGYTLGQQGAVFAISVTNNGNAPTSGTVQVSDVLPSTLSYVSASGTGWTCNSTLACTRTDSLGIGGMYPVITVTVNVAANAPALITNVANVSGGSSPAGGASDSIVVGSATPTSATGGGSGLSNTFTFTFASPSGVANIRKVNILINNFLDGRQGCYLAFLPSGTNGGNLYLVDDAGDAGGPYSGAVLPGTGTAQNSQCTVGGQGALVSQTGSVGGVGGTLTLTLPITFSSRFAGNKIFYLAAEDTSGFNSGWQALSTWNVPGQVASGPGVGAMSPAQGSFQNQTYTFTFNDTNGWRDIAVTNVLVNNFLDGRGGCYLAIVPSTGTVYLVDDAGESAGPYASMTLPGTGSVQNSQCTITGVGSAMSGSGNTLTLTLAVQFSQSFAGNKVFYLATGTAGGQNTGWQSVGTVNIP